MKNKLITVTLFILSSFLLYLRITLAAPQLDPFYQRLFNEGETAFFNQNYKDAARALGIAVFGLNNEKKLLGKAYVYLGISYFYLNDKEKSRQTLVKASKLMGEDGFKILELQESTSMNLEKLLDQLGLRKVPVVKSEDKSLTEPPLPLNQFPVPQENLPRNVALEQVLATDPENAAHYYAVYSVYVRKRDQRTARRVLQELIKKKPEEASAYYLLGKIEFFQNKYERALGYFNALLAPTLWGGLYDEIKVKTVIFLTLSLFYLEPNQSVSFYLGYIQKGAPEEMIQLMLKQEGLESAWQKLKTEVLKTT